MRVCVCAREHHPGKEEGCPRGNSGAGYSRSQAGQRLRNLQQGPEGQRAVEARPSRDQRPTGLGFGPRIIRKLSELLSQRR